ncbi:hypothetical protein GC102_05380 [Paenibacillus sp. LMG 31460]|uniref:Uncharacterized protein n=1 Tax=Paenibacillus germinis TaxID=2654979 RepID=A0ABX1YXD8_9BACL|nr:hypothetical protein [Paenibacillus germinis]NOU85214.1 hypothetical protein [Paenibacillus germinis]
MKVKRSLKLYAGIIIAIAIILFVLNITLQPPPKPSNPAATIPPSTTIPTNSDPVRSSSPTPVVPIDLKPTMRWYDPASIRIGDQVAAWKITDKQQETYGKGSVAYTMESEAIISGSFMVNYEDADYNSNQIVFIADEESSFGLPQPLVFKGHSNRMILHIPKSEDQIRFGIPGSTGRATIVIHKYFSVYADILEGVSDVAEVNHINKVETTPPPATEIVQTEFNKTLQTFPLSPLALDAGKETDAESLQLMQDWFKQVNNQFTKSLGSFHFKRISPAQKDQLQEWLMQSFTEAKAKEILAIHAPQSGIHHLLSSSSLDLKPFGEVKEVKNQELKLEDSETLSFKALYILSGTHDAQFTYVLKRVNGAWKIHQYAMKLI